MVTTVVLLDVSVDDEDDDDEHGASSVLPPGGCSGVVEEVVEAVVVEEEVVVGAVVVGTVVVGAAVVVMVGGPVMSSCTEGRMERVAERTSMFPPLSSPSISVSSAVASCSVCWQTQQKLYIYFVVVVPMADLPHFENMT